jgi:ribonuclease P protein component
LSTDELNTVACDSGVTATDSSFGFPKRFRLTKTDEYSSVFGFRSTVRSSHFLLHYRPRAQEGELRPAGLTARLGVVVPKRFLKAAVRRNLVKRLGREQFRLLRAQLPQNDLILRLAVKPLVLDRKALAEEIRKLFLKLKAPRR